MPGSGDWRIRLAVALLALAACAWFVIGIRQARDTDRASAFVTSHTTATAAQARAVEAQLDSAAFLNPDQTVNLLRGRILGERGQYRQGQQLIEAVTRDEPENLAAWGSLVFVSPHSPALYRKALDQVKRLDPRTG